MGNGLQGGRTLIGKPHAHKEPSLLQGRKERREMSFYCFKIHGLGAGLLQVAKSGQGLEEGLLQVAEIGRDLEEGLLLYCKWWRLGGTWKRG